MHYDVTLDKMPPGAATCAHPLLPLDVTGDFGPAHEAEPLPASTAAPDVDVGVADDQHVRAEGRPRRCASAIGVFGAGDQVVDENADASVRSGTELAQLSRQVVNAEVLDDDAFEPQVVTPDLLDQLGVVATLDEDPALAGHVPSAPVTATRWSAVAAGGRRTRSGPGRR